MNMKFGFVFAFALLQTSLTAASLVGPTAGWTLDSRTATIRAIAGLPGALRLADPITLPFGIAAAEFAASGDVAVALTTDQPAHLVVLQAFRSASPNIIDLGDAASDARLLPLPAKSDNAAVYSATAQQIWFVTQLNGQSQLSAPVSTAALAGPVTAALLDAHGCALLGTGSVETLCQDGTSRRLVPESTLEITGLAISGSDLWVADAASNTVFRVASYADHSAEVVFASAQNGLLAPSALAIAPSGAVLVADNSAAMLFAIDPSSPNILALPLSVNASQLRPLTDRSLLLLNDLSALPFTVFSTDAMRTYFVPAN